MFSEEAYFSGGFSKAALVPMKLVASAQAKGTGTQEILSLQGCSSPPIRRAPQQGSVTAAIYPCLNMPVWHSTQNWVFGAYSQS